MSKARAVRPELLTLLVSLAFLLFYNLPLWQRLLAITPAGWQGLGMMLAVGLMIAAIFNLALTLLAFRWLLKPALTLLILAAAGTTYFMTQYGVLMDVGMLRNVMQTNPAEVADLLSPKLAVYLALLGALPVWLLWRTPVRYRPWPRELLSKLLVALACLALLAGVALANYQGLSSLFRNNKELRLQVTPSNLVGAAIGYAKGQAQAASQPLRPIAVDARRADLWQGHARKSLTVLVVGESAGTELRPQRLRSRDQPAAEGRGGPDQLLQCALLRYRDRGVGALHVLQPGPRGLQRRSRAHPGRPSRCVAARRPAGPVAGQPVRLQGHLRPRRLPGPEREQGSGPVRRRRVS